MIDKIVSRAPARVCLFGDHQDYLNLPIIATTIDRTIEVSAISPAMPVCNHQLFLFGRGMISSFIDLP